MLPLSLTRNGGVMTSERCNRGGLWFTEVAGTARRAEPPVGLSSATTSEPSSISTENEDVGSSPVADRDTVESLSIMTTTVS
jgi:hypothetical protein